MRLQHYLRKLEGRNVSKNKWRFASPEAQQQFQSVKSSVGTFLDDKDACLQVSIHVSKSYVEHQRALIAAQKLNVLLTEFECYLEMRESSKLLHPRILKHNLCSLTSHCIPTNTAIHTILKYGKRVIDVGAGTGYWGMLLAQAGADVVCIDK